MIRNRKTDNKDYIKQCLGIAESRKSSVGIASHLKERIDGPVFVTPLSLHNRFDHIHLHIGKHFVHLFNVFFADHNRLRLCLLWLNGGRRTRLDVDLRQRLIWHNTVSVGHHKRDGSHSWARQRVTSVLQSCSVQWLKMKTFE